jgi:Protein of unknown function (DUF3014)
MSRYDRNRNKKSNNTTFVIAILVSLLFGISGTYYVMENLKKLKEAEATASDKAQANKITVSEESREEQAVVEDRGLELIPPVVPEILLSNDDQSSAQKSGLPDLLDSDNPFRQAVIKIAPGLAQWLNTDQLIRKHVLIINDFAQGLRIAKHMNFLRLDEQFSVEQGKNGTLIAAKSFQRYDKLAQSIQAIGAKAAVALYQKFRPLMLQVFAEFSYPQDITLETIVKKAMAEILAAPAIEEQITLTRPSVYYKFADPKLEALSPVQKQMMRMGPVNTRIIQAKCREFLVELAKSGVN